MPIIAGTAMTSPAAAQPSTFRGPDVASYQHPKTTTHKCGKPINWNAVAGDNVSFAIVKATEGTTYTNPCFTQDYDGSLNAGLVHGSYHFARPGQPIVSNALAQADAYARTIGPVTTADTLPPALDLETTGGLNPAQLVTWAQAFLIRVRNDTDRTPLLYTYPNFWTGAVGDAPAFVRFPLWMASYCHQTCTPPDAELYQYTDNASVSGIKGGVDMSKFLGTPSDWATLSDGTIASPWVAAAPEPPRNVHASIATSHSITVSWLPGDAGTARVTGYTVTATEVSASTVPDQRSKTAASASPTPSASPTATPTPSTSPTSTATPSPPPGSTTVTVGGATTSATVTGLVAGASYQFSVVATNGVGSSVTSTPSARLKLLEPATLSESIPSSITYGSALPVHATLSVAGSGEPLDGRNVVLSQRAHGATAWKAVTTLTTDSSGVVTTTLNPTRNIDLKLSFAGTAAIKAASVVLTVLVRPVVTATLSKTSVQAGQLVILSGTAAPFVAGQKVSREGYYNGAWHLWATTTISKKGTYSFRIKPTVSTNIYRVVVAAAHHLAPGYSPNVTLKATKKKKK